MKILNIYFKNINSLEGENRIHFDQAPLADGGVFAITGPNGSGKSSILDAISLALYGETNRFNRPSEHVMTKGCHESFATVEFALGDNTYRSRWSLKRQAGKADDLMTDPEMQLFQLGDSEQILATTSATVRQKLIELTGMDFHKFAKSIILAQGDFAAFLNALDSERMDILEKISGTDIYETYQQRIENDYQIERGRLQQLQQDLAAIPLLEVADYESAQLDLNDFKEQRTEIETKIQSVQANLDRLNKIDSLSAKSEQLEQEYQQLQKNESDHLQQLEEIVSLEKTLTLEESLNRYQNKINEKEVIRQSLDELNRELGLLQQQLTQPISDSAQQVSITEQKQTLAELNVKQSELKQTLVQQESLLTSLGQQITQKQPVLDAIQQWLQENDKDALLLDSLPETGRLKRLQTDLQQLKQKYAEFQKNGQLNTSNLARVQTEITQTEQKIKESGEQVEQFEIHLQQISEGRRLEQLEDLRQEQQIRVDDFIELFDLAGVHKKLTHKQFWMPWFEPKMDLEEQQLQSVSDQVQMKLGREENILKTLEQAVKTEALLQKMEPDRIHLVDGKPCPLCGALEHPYTRKAPTPSNSKQALQDQQKKVKSLTAELESVKKQLTAMEKQSEKNSQKDSKLQQIRTQWHVLANKLNIASEPMSIDNLSLMKELLKTEKEQLGNIQNLIKRYQKKQNAIATQKAKAATLLNALSRLNTDKIGLQRAVDAYPEEIAQLEKDVTRLAEQEQALSEKVTLQLLKLGETIPNQKQEAALSERLNMRRHEYQTNLNRKDALVKEIKALTSQQETGKQELNSLKNQLSACSDQLDNQQQVGLHLALIEKQKLIADKEQRLDLLQIESEQYQNELLKQAQALNQQTLKMLADSIARVHEKPKIEADLKQFAEQMTLNREKLNLNQQALLQEQALKACEETLDELKQEQQSLSEKLQITDLEIRRVQDLINKQNELQNRHDDLQDKILAQSTVLSHCEKDFKSLTEGGGVHFRHKVQQILADQLLAQSNKVLEKISGRYFLRKTESEHGLALVIEDVKQHNAKRLPKTLSGGESFVVSLALAIGLAEMASGKVSIDSLFIDEGFGNLDEESLYLAMTTLESLKTHGKTVGVISHVDGVKKRIKTQIEMVKKPNGFSGLKLVA
jgi:exonuclease SbcC